VKDETIIILNFTRVSDCSILVETNSPALQIIDDMPSILTSIKNDMKLIPMVGNIHLIFSGDSVNVKLPRYRINFGTTSLNFIVYVFAAQTQVIDLLGRNIITVETSKYIGSPFDISCNGSANCLADLSISYSKENLELHSGLTLEIF